MRCLPHCKQRVAEQAPAWLFTRGFSLRRLEGTATRQASVVQEDVEEGTVNAHAAIVVDEAQLAELI